jgi:hypothetical protein
MPFTFSLKSAAGHYNVDRDWQWREIVLRSGSKPPKISLIPSGSFIASYSGGGVLDKVGHRILGMLTLHDITAQKAAEAERERLLGQLDTRQSRMKAVQNRGSTEKEKKKWQMQ